MTYMSGLIVRATNVDSLISDMDSFGREAFQDAGASNMWITQNVYAGDGAGEIGISTDWASIDAAVTAPNDLRARPEFVMQCKMRVYKPSGEAWSKSGQNEGNSTESLEALLLVLEHNKIKKP